MLNVINDPTKLDFSKAEIFDVRLVVAAAQCNPLLVATGSVASLAAVRDVVEDVAERLRQGGFETDPADPSLYRSIYVAPSLSVRAIKLEGPTQILYPSGARRLESGWIVQRITDAEIFLVPEHEFASHYVLRHQGKTSGT